MRSVKEHYIAHKPPNIYVAQAYCHIYIYQSTCVCIITVSVSLSQTEAPFGQNQQANSVKKQAKACLINKHCLSFIYVYAFCQSRSRSPSTIPIK